MSREKGIEIKVGALVLFSLSLLVAFVVVLSDFGLDEGVTLYVEFEDIGGLKPGAEVKLGGIEIGKVRGIELIEGTPSEVTKEPIWAKVELEIEPERFELLRKESVFSISSESVLGEKFVSVKILDPKGEKISPEHTFRGRDPIRIDDVVARANSALAKVEGALGGEAMEVEALVSQLTTLAENANALVHDNRGRVDHLLEQSDQLVTQLNEVVSDHRGDIKEAVGRVQGILVRGEETVGRVLGLVKRIDNEVDPLLVDARAAMDETQRAASTAAQLMEESAPKVNTLLDDAGVALTEVREASQDAAALVDYVSQGRGTIGLLLKDEEIFDDMREMLRELKRRPWKIIWKE